MQVYEFYKEVQFSFQTACPKFAFNIKNDNELLFIDQYELFSYDIQTKKTKTIHKIQDEFDKQPTQVVFNDDQTIFIATTYINALYVDINKEMEVDIDDAEEVSNIHNIIYSNEMFYVMSNKRSGKLG